MTARSTAHRPTTNLPLRALLIGISAGSRAMTPNAVLAVRQPHHASARWAHWVPYRWPLGRAGLVVGMLGELVGDKLPSTPSRLEPGSLAGRIGSGALAGAAIGSDGGRSGIVTGAACGAVGAVAGTFGGYWARKRLVEKSGLPDLPIALLEDAAAVGLAAMATEQRPS